MSKSSKLTALAVVVSGFANPAAAQDSSALTRSEVQFELQVARASGEMAAFNGEDSGSFWLSSREHRSDAAPRSKVSAEPPGLAAALLGEDSGSAYLSANAASSALTRAEVRAELAAARNRGELQAMIGEDSGSAYLPANTPSSALTRAEVLAGVAAARNRGELQAMIGEDSGASFLARQRAWIETLYAGPNGGQGQQPSDAPAAG